MVLGGGQNMTNIGSSLAFLGSSLALGKSSCSMAGKIGGSYGLAARVFNAVNVGLARSRCCC